VAKKRTQTVRPLLRPDHEGIREQVEKLRNRLESDKRFSEALSSLIDQGLELSWKPSDPSAVCLCLVNRLPTILGEWHALKEDSLPRIRKRHKALATKMRKLADEIELDYETRIGLHVVDPEVYKFSYQKFYGYDDFIDRNRPDRIKTYNENVDRIERLYTVPLSLYLFEYADFLEQDGIVDRMDRELLEMRPAKGQFKTFVIKAIAKKIRELKPTTLSKMGKEEIFSPIQEIAKIATVFLDLEKPLTQSDVSHALEGTGNHYLQREKDRLPPD